MADFRRCFLVLAALALLAGLVVPASAQPTQPLTCSVNTQAPPLIRAEGITEKLGDLVMTCTGGTATDPGAVGGLVAPLTATAGAICSYNCGPTANIQIFTAQSGINFTSKILGTANNASEALLMIDEPAPANQNVCQVPASGTVNCAVAGVGGAATTSPYVPNGQDAHPFNVFQGQQVGGNSIAFLGVPIIPPGTAGGTRIIRITNVRLNATAYGTTTLQPVTVFISVSPSTVLPIQNTLQTVAFVQPGLRLTTTPPAGAFQQCTDVTDGAAGSITFTEGFATAFKTRDTTATAGTIGPDQDTPLNSVCDYLAVCPVGLSPNTESGFFNASNTGGGLNWGSGTGGNLATAGVASFGTRLRVYFSAVQSGVTISALDTVISNGTLTLHAISDPLGAYAPIAGSAGSCTTGTCFSLTPDSSGNAIAYYEVTAQDPTVVETATIPFAISYTASPGTGSPALGTANFDGSFAPAESTASGVPNDSTEALTAWNAASSSDPIPRFMDNNPLQPWVVIVKCATHLLFPFATNQVGFDTGLAISNTSLDVYGTSVQDGGCTLHFFQFASGAGTNPADYPITDVAPGTTWASTVMAIAPGFQGYVIADCQFQYAHGFAFVTRVGATDIAMGYLALVIPDYPPRIPNPVSCPPNTAGCGSGSGEQLAQ